MAELTSLEKETLKKYRLYLDDHKASQSKISGCDLLKSEQLLMLFNGDLSEKLNTNKHNVIGSMLVKRYAFLAALVLYSMSMYDKGFDSSIGNLSLITDEDDPIWLPSFNFDKLEVTTPAADDREVWRAEVVETLFKDNIAFILSSILKTGKVAKSILWENIAIYIFWMYESLLEDESISEDLKEKVRKDFYYVVTEAPAQSFGLKAKNPLSQYFHEKVNQVRKRTTCCLFYFTSKNDDRCNTCPIECKRPTK